MTPVTPTSRRQRPESPSPMGGLPTGSLALRAEVVHRDVDPKAPRLVGHVLATTHERVPWHRVVRADGSVPMGDAQRARLRREGVPLNGGRVDLARARMAG